MGSCTMESDGMVIAQLMIIKVHSVHGITDSFTVCRKDKATHSQERFIGPLSTVLRLNSEAPSMVMTSLMKNTKSFKYSDC